MSKRKEKIKNNIDEAIKRGDLIPFEQIWNRYSKKEQGEIMKRARYLMASMELREIRNRLNLSQAQLAKKIGTKREFISRLESGRQNVTMETLYRIGAALGKRVEVRFC